MATSRRPHTRETAGEVLGKTPRLLQGARTDKALLARLRQTLARGEPFEGEIINYRKDGSEFYSEMRIAPIRDPNGLVTHFAAGKRDITERKRAEEALRASQQILEGILNAIPVRVFWKDKNLIYLGCNTIFARDAGFADPKDIIGKDDYQMGWRDQAEKYRADDRQVIESGLSKLLMEETQTTPQGSTITLLSSKIPLRASTGEISGILGTYLDITKRKRAEEALGRSREEFKDLFDNAPVGSHEVDAEGRLVRINNTELKMLGYSAEELLGQFVWKISMEEETSRRAALAKLAGELPPPQGFVRKFRRKDGSAFPVLITDRILKREDGAIIGIRAAVQDITERKRDEEALVRTSALLEALLQNTTDLIYFKDKESRFVQFSRKMLEHFHLTNPNELTGRTDFDFFSAEHARPAFEAELEIIRSGKPILNLEEKENHLDGRVTWVSTSKMPWRDNAGNIIGTMGISRDITERKRIEVRLFQSQKMETVGKLAGGIAHEFNSIMTAIIGQCELMIFDLPAGNPLRKNASQIHQAADRAAGLTRQLLAYGRKQILQPDVLDLNTVLAGMENTLRHLAGRDVDLRIAPAAAPMLVKADPGQIEQVIVNIVMNAADAMPRGAN